MSILRRSGISCGVAVLMSAHSLQALDMKEFSVLKGQKFVQTGVSAPQPAPGNSVVFDATAVPLLSMFVSSCSLQLPSGVTKTMAKGSDNYTLSASAATTAAIETDYSAGNYSFKYAGQNDGAATVTLALPAAQYPPAPAVNNFSAAQAIDPAGDFTLSWSSWPGGTGQDSIQLTIKDDTGSEVFSYGTASDGNELTGTATSVVIPAEKLETTKTYTATLSFRKIVLNESVSVFETHLGGFFAATDIIVKTKGGGVGNEDTTPPILLSSVATTNGLALMTFLFNEPMSENQSVQWSANLSAAQIIYQWVDDTKLMCVFASGLPANGTMIWTLNPSANDPNNFTDLAGNPLALTTGSFMTGNGGGTSTNNPCDAPDRTSQIGDFFVAKQISYLQSNSGAPAIKPDEGASFTAMVAVPSGSDGKVLLQIPTVPPSDKLLDVMPFSLGNNVFQAYYLTNYATEAALEQAMPSGIYKLAVNMPNFTPAEIAFPQNGFPPTPRISNYDAAQRVNLDADFTLSWDAYTGAADHDSIALSITENGVEVFQAPNPCVPIELAATDASILIPKGVIKTGKTYEGSLTFSHIIAYNMPIMNGATNGGVAMLQKTTSFNMAIDSGLIDPVFKSIKKTPSGGVSLEIECNPGRTLTLKRSSTVGASFSNWVDALATNVVSSPITIILPKEENVRFYRATQN